MHIMVYLCTEVVSDCICVVSKDGVNSICPFPIPNQIPFDQLQFHTVNFSNQANTIPNQFRLHLSNSKSNSNSSKL